MSTPGQEDVDQNARIIHDMLQRNKERLAGLKEQLQRMKDQVQKEKEASPKNTKTLRDHLKVEAEQLNRDTSDIPEVLQRNRRRIDKLRGELQEALKQRLNLKQTVELITLAINGSTLRISEATHQKDEWLNTLKREVRRLLEEVRDIKIKLADTKSEWQWLMSDEGLIAHKARLHGTLQEYAKVYGERRNLLLKQKELLNLRKEDIMIKLWRPRIDLAAEIDSREKIRTKPRTRAETRSHTQIDFEELLSSRDIKGKGNEQRREGESSGSMPNAGDSHPSSIAATNKGKVKSKTQDSSRKQTAHEPISIDFKMLQGGKFRDLPSVNVDNLAVFQDYLKRKMKGKLLLYNTRMCMMDPETAFENVIKNGTRLILLIPQAFNIYNRQLRAAIAELHDEAVSRHALLKRSAQDVPVRHDRRKYQAAS